MLDDDTTFIQTEGGAKGDAVEPQDDALILAVSVCIDQMARE